MNNSKRVVRIWEENNVGTRGKSPEQGLTSAKDLTIELPEGRDSRTNVSNDMETMTIINAITSACITLLQVAGIVIYCLLSIIDCRDLEERVKSLSHDIYYTIALTIVSYIKYGN